MQNFNPMNFIPKDFDIKQMANLVINNLPYPISKHDLLQQVEKLGFGEQARPILDKLPDTTFNSPDDIKRILGLTGL